MYLTYSILCTKHADWSPCGERNFLKDFGQYMRQYSPNITS